VLSLLQLLLIPLVFVAVTGLWQMVTALKLVSPILLPGPAVVFKAFVGLITAPWFPAHLMATAIETSVGFVVGSVLAIAAATGLHHSQLVRKVMYPYILIFQLTPSVVLAPIFIIWFGLGMESKIVVSLTTVFFGVLVNSLQGFEAVEEEAHLLMRSLFASRFRTFRMLTFPTALPYIFAGLKTGTTMALIGALVGEFISAQKGLGRLLSQFSFNLRQDLVFATIIVVILLGLVLFGAVEVLYRWIVWWRPGGAK
jgi:NitT/TauT family transport system permease protein